MGQSFNRIDGTTLRSILRHTRKGKYDPVIGKRIRPKNFNLKQLAKKMDVAENVLVSYLYNNSILPPLSFLIRLFEYLRINLKDLFGIKPEAFDEFVAIFQTEEPLNHRDKIALLKTFLEINDMAKNPPKKKGGAKKC